MNCYKYWGYGLHIASEIEFPELLPYEFAGLPDLTIGVDIAPKSINAEGVVNKVRVSISPLEYLLRVRNIANYYAANGNQITVEPLPGADEKSVRLFLLSNGMAAILHQRSMISMHASAIEHEDGVILLCGRSGVGKSTTASILQKMGYNLFSDDVCVLKYPEVSENPIEAYPSYPMVKLWRDSFEKLGIEMAVECNKIRPQLPKYARFFHDAFNIAPKQVKQVFILDKDSDIKEAGIEKLGPLNAFLELQKNTYKHGQMNSMKKRDVHFAMMSELTRTALVYKIARPETGNTIGKVAGLITRVLQKNE